MFIFGLPWWRSGWESACQCRRHGFASWSGRIPHAAEQLGPWATTTEPVRLEPVLHNKRGHDSERPAHRDEEWPPLAATIESPSTETKTQHSNQSINQSINQSLKKKCSFFSGERVHSFHQILTGVYYREKSKNHFYELIYLWKCFYFVPIHFLQKNFFKYQ